MRDTEPSRPRAVVVAPSDAEREKACRTLVASGYDTVGFLDCGNASAWLEEETPVVAILFVDASCDCEAFLSQLRERGTEIERR